jgi:hypothetical protein
MDNGDGLNITQETRYPWDGAIKITVSPEHNRKISINVRIPGWACNEPVPSNLYRFADTVTEPVILKVNGKPIPVKIDKGYVALDRTWKKGDVIELNLPMPVRRVVANGEVAADRGRVALQRGPIVYAAEWPDNPNGKVRNLMLPDTSKLTAEFRPDLLGGVSVVKARAIGLAYDAQGRVIAKEQDFTAIPYYAWANRGRGQMVVWMPGSEASAKPTPWPTIATTSKVTTSGRKNPRAINDGEEPASSNDPTSYFDWWPTKSTSEWAEYAFEKPVTISEVEVYWFDDTGRGEVRVPASWRVLYRDGDQWKAVEYGGAYGVERDKYNKVTFKPVTTNGLRLEVTMQPTWSVGIQKWKVK